MAQQKILIVDGDVTHAEMIETHLSAKGYVVNRVVDGNKALQILEAEWYDLVILAVTLRGGTDGFHFLKEVRKNDELDKIPVIVQTGKVAMKDIFMAMGVADFVEKPFDVDDFVVNKVETLLKSL